MTTLVVDASVAIKWFLPEHDAAQAARLLDGRFRLLAPDLLWIEVASVLWKVARRGTITANEAQQIITDASAFPVELIESLPLLSSAMQIATKSDRTVYDSVYIALAERERAATITADERLVNALGHTPWAKNVMLLSKL